MVCPAHLVASLNERLLDGEARAAVHAFRDATFDLVEEQNPAKLWDRMARLAEQSRTLHKQVGDVLRALV